MFGRLFLLFTFVPIVELWLLIKIGGVIGPVPTLVIVLGTGALGANLARREGLRTFAAFERATARGELPTEALFDGVLILIGGVLLITPGIITDALGLLLLVPPARRALRHLLRRSVERHIARANIVVTGMGARPVDPRTPRDPSRIVDQHFD